MNQFGNLAYVFTLPALVPRVYLLAYDYDIHFGSSSFLHFLNKCFVPQRFVSVCEITSNSPYSIDIELRQS